MNTVTSSATIQKLECSFAEHRLPDQCITDNGMCFTSAEFEQYMKVNGVKHTCPAPYHLSSNGQAEHTLQTFKEALKKITDGDIETRICRFLLQYRTTPHTTAGASLAELLRNKKLSTHLSKLHPSIHICVLEKQQACKTYYDKHSKERPFAERDQVFAKKFQYQWQEMDTRVDQDKTGPASVTIRLYDGSVVCRHTDYVRKWWVTNIENEPVITPPEVTTTSAIEWKVVQVNRVMERVITQGAMWI